MFRKRFQRKNFDTHVQQQELDDIFTSLSSLLELHTNLFELKEQTGDPIIQKAYQDTKQEITEKIKTLYGRGVSVVDLVQRYGSLLVKSQILNAQEKISKQESQSGEIVLTDLVSEDQIIDDRNTIDQAQYVKQIGQELGYFSKKTTLEEAAKSKRLKEISTIVARRKALIPITQGLQDIEKQTKDVTLQEIRNKYNSAVQEASVEEAKGEGHEEVKGEGAEEVKVEDPSMGMAGAARGDGPAARGDGDGGVKKIQNPIYKKGDSFDAYLFNYTINLIKDTDDMMKKSLKDKPLEEYGKVSAQTIKDMNILKESYVKAQKTLKQNKQNEKITKDKYNKSLEDLRTDYLTSLLEINNILTYERNKLAQYKTSVEETKLEIPTLVIKLSEKQKTQISDDEQEQDEEDKELEEEQKKDIETIKMKNADRKQRREKLSEDTQKDQEVIDALKEKVLSESDQIVELRKQIKILLKERKDLNTTLQREQEDIEKEQEGAVGKSLKDVSDAQTEMLQIKYNLQMASEQEIQKYIKTKRYQLVQDKIQGLLDKYEDVSKQESDDIIKVFKNFTPRVGQIDKDIVEDLTKVIKELKEPSKHKDALDLINKKYLEVDILAGQIESQLTGGEEKVLNNEDQPKFKEEVDALTKQGMNQRVAIVHLIQDHLKTVAMKKNLISQGYTKEYVGIIETIAEAPKKIEKEPKKKKPKV